MQNSKSRQMIGKQMEPAAQNIAAAFKFASGKLLARLATIQPTPSAIIPVIARNTESTKMDKVAKGLIAKCEAELTNSAAKGINKILRSFIAGETRERDNLLRVRWGTSRRLRKV